jgi:hypothetical protein
MTLLAKVLLVLASFVILSLTPLRWFHLRVLFWTLCFIVAI